MPLFENHGAPDRRRLAFLILAALAALVLTGPPSARAAGCRHADVVFYSTDTLRLVQRLALNPSPCADYYVSATPGVGTLGTTDLTGVRNGVAGPIHAAGPHFHGMPEIRTAAWSAWAAATGKTMYDAGVEARRRMVAAGYDVTTGDTWAVNESSSAVLANTGTARADLRDFVRCLYTGDTGMPPSAGLVFVTDPPQTAPDVSQYKQQLQDWYADTPFWTDMSSYVRFWAQETYADPRNWGVAGTTLADRRDHLDDYLMHAARLAAAGPAGTTAAAQAFIARAYTPVGDAAWPRPASSGFPDTTTVPAPTMEAFIAAETYAMRHAQAPGGDRLGFAWSPPSGSTVPAATYIDMLDHLASALHSSDDADADVVGACGPGRTL